MKNPIRATADLCFQIWAAGALLLILGILPALATGRLIVSHDDLVMADVGFHGDADPAAFARNLANWFTGGRPGRFLAYSDDQALTGANLATVLMGAGHSFTVSTSTEMTLSNLLTFDGLFLCATPVDGNLLAEYINAGGNVYLAGVGVPSLDATQWNSFLERFGLAFAGVGTGVEDFPISSTHQVFQGVDRLYGVNGTAIVDLEPINPTNRIVASKMATGLFAVWEDASDAEAFDSRSEFIGFQGGVSGTWFYEEYDGSAFRALTFKPNGNGFSGFQPGWTGVSELPLLFKDSAVADGLVFHPGAPGGSQPARHDISLSWMALEAGVYLVQGFVRGDGRIGAGGNGFRFGAYRDGETLSELDIEPTDKSNHTVLLRSVRLEAGQRVNFRVWDKGNNEVDYGVFNFRIRRHDARLQIRVSEVELCWVTASNVISRLEYRSDLTDGMWRLLGTNSFLGDGELKCVYDRVPFGEPQRFYRVVTNDVPQIELSPQ